MSIDQPTFCHTIVVAGEYHSQWVIGLAGKQAKSSQHDHTCSTHKHAPKQPRSAPSQFSGINAESHGFTVRRNKISDIRNLFSLI